MSLTAVEEAPKIRVLSVFGTRPRKLWCRHVPVPDPAWIPGAPARFFPGWALSERIHPHLSLAQPEPNKKELFSCPLPQWKMGIHPQNR